MVLKIGFVFHIDDLINGLNRPEGLWSLKG